MVDSSFELFNVMKEGDRTVHDVVTARLLWL